MLDPGPPTLQEVAYSRIREPRKTLFHDENRIGIQRLSALGVMPSERINKAGEQRGAGRLGYRHWSRSKCYAGEVSLISDRCMGRRALRPSDDGHVAPPKARLRLLVIVMSSLCIPVSAATWSVRNEPARLLNGAPVLFQVKPAAKLDSLTGTWLGHEVTFSYNASTKNWFALAGVSIETKPGRYPMELKGKGASGKAVTFTRTFTVARAVYPKIKVQLAVQKKFTEPSPEQQTQIAESVKVKQDYLGRVTPDREWRGNFDAPVEAATSDIFGSQRIFNGVAQRPHFGLDYRVPTGTAVHAMNGGTILLARFLYFEGNCVVIDHGQGLLTLYFHLSELKVKEGDSVKRGEEIGLSGGTGRATGPHLHVAVRWQGTYLDPARLLQMSLP